MISKPTALEFFAGSGLARQGLGLWFDVCWANDICPKKFATYKANFGGREFHLGPIEDIVGAGLPQSDLAWASFPCQDLSLAGKLAGMKEDETRSGLFWKFLNIIDEIPRYKRPNVLALENVVGWFSSNGGNDFARAYNALKNRGYVAGALVVDAKYFVPQSRPRAFLIAVERGTDLSRLQGEAPNASSHFFPAPLLRANRNIGDPDWIWWQLPTPPKRNADFIDICEIDAPRDDNEVTEKLVSMLSPRNQQKLEQAIASGRYIAGTGYKRTRRNEQGEKVQRLEIRFDGVAGCLRTPEGGSSRQTVLLVENGEVYTRLLTTRETARLMGAPENFKLVGSYNEQYKAMGDAVCVPVVSWITENLLSPLCLRSREIRVAAAE